MPVNDQGPPSCQVQHSDFWVHCFVPPVPCTFEFLLLGRPFTLIGDTLMTWHIFASGALCVRAEEGDWGCGWASLPSIALCVSLTFFWSSSDPNWVILLAVYLENSAKNKYCSIIMWSKPHIIILHVSIIMQKWCVLLTWKTHHLKALCFSFFTVWNFLLHES